MKKNVIFITSAGHFPTQQLLQHDQGTAEPFGLRNTVNHEGKLLFLWISVEKKNPHFEKTCIFQHYAENPDESSSPAGFYSRFLPSSGQVYVWHTDLSKYKKTLDKDTFFHFYFPFHNNLYLQTF